VVTQFISTSVDKIPPIPSRTQNASQHVITKSLPYQRGHKMHLNMCWSFPYIASENNKCIWTCVACRKI